jgi:hypothetical protein
MADETCTCPIVPPGSIFTVTSNHIHLLDKRDGKWTESIAVGSELFVSTTKDKLGIKAKGRDVFGTDGSYELREDPGHYKQLLGHEKAGLSPENAYYWSDRF